MPDAWQEFIFNTNLLHAGAAEGVLADRAAHVATVLQSSGLMRRRLHVGSNVLTNPHTLFNIKTHICSFFFYLTNSIITLKVLMCPSTQS